jgi:CrcB protein
MMTYFWVALGGAIGTVGRFALSRTVALHFGETFPWGTLIINVTGSFVIGFFATLTDPDGGRLVRPDARSFVLVGICGGYTTFSSFSYQTLTLAQNNQWLGATANVVGSNVGCLAAVWLGHICAAALRR